ncbi:unnamed protein product [Linum tenue]|uniref:C3H1-type domain-containing protein n=1 Tax=Linum tenue TaxID=586396 RepID=A0AAV0NFN5_9ROSI|nr:unnamed protein product [Linum tenue]
MSIHEQIRVPHVKPSSSRSVCRFWQQGICNRNPCKFAHGGELPPRPPPPPPRSSHVYLRGSRSESQSKPVGGSAAPKKHEEKVCRDWKSGNCSRGDDKCRFLHSWSRGEGFSMLARLEGHSNTAVVSGIALPSGSDKLFTGSSDGVVQAWDCTSGKIVGTLNAGGKIGCLITEGEWLFVGLPNVVKAWNLQTGVDCSLTGPTGQVYALEVGMGFLFAGGSPDGGSSSTGEQQGSNPFQPAAALNGHTSAVISIEVGGGGKLFSGSMDGTIKVWDIKTLQCIQTIEKGHDSAVMSLLCYSDFLLSCSLDQKIKVWAATGEDGRFEAVYTHEEGHGAISMCGVEDMDGKPVLLCSWNDDSVGLYELPSFAEKGRMYAKGEVRSIKGGPGGLVFTGDATGLVTVWKLAAGATSGAAMAE